MSKEKRETNGIQKQAGDTAGVQNRLFKTIFTNRWKEP